MVAAAGTVDALKGNEPKVGVEEAVVEWRRSRARTRGNGSADKGKGGGGCFEGE